MCTVALAHRLFPGHPLVLAANRDEQRARASRSWAREDGLLAPRDLVAGGTWIGLGVGGVVVAVTNRFGHVRDPVRRSRGLVVREALSAGSVAAAVAQVRALPPESVSPFHLLVADAEQARLVFHDGAALHERALSPGWTVITERSLGAASTTREARVQAALDALGTTSAPAPDALREVLRVHAPATAEHLEDRVGATCVHLDEHGYGTRSSSLLYLGPVGDELWHADGAPCVTPYAPLHTLVAEQLAER